jgi:hypothetical protein
MPVVPGDPARLRQVFDNLIGNGLKYTPAGGPAQVSVTAEVVDDVAVVTVADRGVGIPAEQRDASPGRAPVAAPPSSSRCPWTTWGSGLLDRGDDGHGLDSPALSHVRPPGSTVRADRRPP